MKKALRLPVQQWLGSKRNLYNQEQVVGNFDRAFPLSGKPYQIIPKLKLMLFVFLLNKLLLFNKYMQWQKLSSLLRTNQFNQ